jgi:hypothetical protein
MKLIGFVNHSGGAVGSDTAWETIGAEFGVITKAYGSENHATKSHNHVALTQVELNQADEFLMRANRSFGIRGAKYKRHFPTHQVYIDNLLRRNWFQVKNSDQIAAIGRIDFDARIVEGGTGWAVQMAIDAKKPVFVFDYRKDVWYMFEYTKDAFVEVETPILQRNFAGIGTRGENMTPNGTRELKHFVLPENVFAAIRRVYEKTASCLTEGIADL